MKQKLDRSPYKHLLADEQFKLWFENMERGCVSSAQEYFKRIGNVCKTFNTTPKELAEMSEEAGNFILKIISHYESNGSSGSNTVHYLYALKN